MYKLIRSLLFKFDPEKVHYFSMNAFSRASKIPVIRSLLPGIFSFNNNHKQTSFCGLNFRNPVGLGAGFDKNALYLNELDKMGFGFVEIGTVTPLPQSGNDKPRLFRLPEDGALINRMGFNNDGAEIIATRMEIWRRTYKGEMLVGGNIGKNKQTTNEDAWQDYLKCFLGLYPWVDYFVVNVSSPNTPGLRELQEKDALTKIIITLQQHEINSAIPKPIFLKIAPDLTLPQVDEIIEMAVNIKLDGLIVSNTTISRENLSASAQQLEKIGNGGVSGKPVKERSTELVKYIHQKSNGQIKMIASGGIFNGDDAQEKLSAGASLIQVWTGFVYEGPGIIKKICDRVKM